MRGLSQDFRLHHVGNAFFYQRDGETAAASTRIDRGPTVAGAPARFTEAPVVDPGATWLETIQRSADRIRALGDGSRSIPTAARPSPPADLRRARSPHIELGRALDLLREERFADALAALDRLPDGAADHLDALVLRAALLTHAGRLGDAEAACEVVLGRDSMSAGAHYLLALCRDGRRDRDGAIEHDQIAAYLDPSFAMPRVHLGLMARRAGDVDTARRELGQAVVLLEREEPERVLLYGGGFTREALIALCSRHGAAEASP
jgi:chemotaxis protein methyltransferase CheR